jgi:hypothetical protein
VSDLRERRAKIEALGTRIVLVHLASEGDAAKFFADAGLADLARVSDPTNELYSALELRSGGPLALFGPRVWWRGFRAGAPRWLGGAGHGVGRPQGDPLQMPGTFLIHRGEIVRAHRHVDAADRPDYCELARPIAAKETQG